MQSSISNKSMERLFSICMKSLFSTCFLLSCNLRWRTQILSFVRAGGKTAPETYVHAYGLPQKGSWNFNRKDFSVLENFNYIPNYFKILGLYFTKIASTFHEKITNFSRCSSYDKDQDLRTLDSMWFPYPIISPLSQRNITFF